MELAEGGHAAAGEDSFNDFHDETGSNHVRVVLRLRPPVSGLRIADGGEHHAMGTAGDVNLAERSLKLPGMPHCIFDEVYSAEMAPDEVYMGTLASLVDGLLAGENGTLFTWGAPGSGKTREVFGESSIEATAVRGLAHIMVDQLFSEINRLHSEQMAGRPALRSSVYASALELGGLEVVDLLAQREGRDPGATLRTPRSAHPLDGATSLKAESPAQLCSILHLARLRLEERRPALPEGLQRRHCVFSVALEVEDDCNGQPVRQVGRLSLVDLAGSAEKAEQTRAACSSALADLVRVVHALTPRQEELPVPYAASPLTQVMQDALGGNCHTVMLLTAVTGADSPSQVVMPTSALQFAARVAEVVNCPAQGSRLLAAKPCAVEEDLSDAWCVRRSYPLCLPGEEACFDGLVPFVSSRGHVTCPAARQSTSPTRGSSSRGRLADLAVSQGASTTLSACVEALNQRSSVAGNFAEGLEMAEAFEDDCCVVFSCANQAYYLLYKYGRRRAALARIGITDLGRGALTVRIVAASELRLADRGEGRRQRLAAFVLARVGSEIQRTETVLDGRHHQLMWNSQPMHFTVDFAEEDQCVLHLEMYEEGRSKHLASTDVAIPLLECGRVLRRREKLVGECGEAVLDIEACFIDQAEARRKPSEAEIDCIVQPGGKWPGNESINGAIDHEGEGACKAEGVEDASTAADSSSAATADAAHCAASAQAYAELCTPLAARLPAPPMALPLPNNAFVGASPLAGDDSVFDVSLDSEGLNVAFRASISPGASNECQMLSPIPRSSALSPEAVAAAAAAPPSMGSCSVSEQTSPEKRPPLPARLPEVDGVPSLVRTMLQQKLAEIAGATLPQAPRLAEGNGATTSPARSVLTAPRDIMSASGSTLSPRSIGGRATPSTPPPGDFDAGLAKKRSRHMADRFAAVQAALEQRTQQLNRTSQRLQEAVQSASRWEAVAERLTVESEKQSDLILALERLLDLALVRQPDMLEDLSGLDEASLKALGQFARNPPDMLDVESKQLQGTRQFPAGSVLEVQPNSVYTGTLSLRSPESGSPTQWRVRPPPPSLAGSPEVVEQSALGPISFGAEAAQRFVAGSGLAQGASEASTQFRSTGSLHTMHLSPLFGNPVGGQTFSNTSSAGTLGERSWSDMPCNASLQRPVFFQPRTHLLSLGQQPREAPGPITSPPTKAHPSDILSASPGAGSAGASAIFEAYDRSQLEAWQAPSPAPPSHFQAPTAPSPQRSVPLRVSRSPPPASGRQSAASMEAAPALGGHGLAAPTVGCSPDGKMQKSRTSSPPPGPPLMQQKKQVSPSRVTPAAPSKSSTPLRHGRVPLTSQIKAAERGAASVSPRRRPQRRMVASPLVKPTTVAAKERLRVGSATPTRFAKTLGVSPIDGIASAPCAGYPGFAAGGACLTARAGSLQNLPFGGEMCSSGHMGSARSGDVAAGVPLKTTPLAIDGMSSARSSPPGFEVPHTASSNGSSESLPPPPVGVLTTQATAAAAIAFRRDGSCGLGVRSACGGSDSARALIRNAVGTSAASMQQGVGGKRSSSPQASLSKAPRGNPSAVIGGYVTPPPSQCLYSQGLTGPPSARVNGTPQPLKLPSGVVTKRPLTPPRTIAYTPPSTPMRGGQGELRLAAASVTPVRVLPPSAPAASARASNGT
mmetsp:Transcript_112792/g.206992  ORF Transcript_112792/g.206992 Transcript_112792/m.206992 type:complete len:1663 (+) Transcript_112792:160-5148(+)